MGGDVTDFVVGLSNDAVMAYPRLVLNVLVVQNQSIRHASTATSRERTRYHLCASLNFVFMIRLGCSSMKTNDLEEKWYV